MADSWGHACPTMKYPELYSNNEAKNRKGLIRLTLEVS